MKYIQKTKSLLETEDLDEKCSLRMGTLSELLKDNSTILKALDKEILAICPTNKDENINLKITKMCAEIDGRSK